MRSKILISLHMVCLRTGNMGNNVYLSYLTAFYDIISNLWEIQYKQMSACKYRTETSCFKHMLLNLKSRAMG